MSLDVNISEPEEFNSVELHSCIENLAKTLGISDFEYHVDHISGGGRENYIANIFRVFIRDSNANSNKSVIVKTLVNTTRQELFHDLHKREVAVYKDVLPKYSEIQEKIEISQKIWFPECLLSSTEKKKEVLILKDLNEDGFIADDEILANYVNIDYSKVELVLKELAKFHSLSFVYEHENSTEFAKIKRNFADLLFQDNFLNKTKLRNYFFESFDMSLQFVEDLEAKKKLEKVRPKLLEILKYYHEPSKYSVLCHGDLWINNILFKKVEDQCQVCFLDFQAMRYTSPVNDIIYFTYLCTTSPFRSNNLPTLINSYYNALKSSLGYHGIDVNVVYPKDDFKEDVKSKLPFGLLIALVELRIVTITSEDDELLKRSTTMPRPSSSVVSGIFDTFKYRVNDLIQESVKNGVLDQLVSMINVKK